MALWSFTVKDPDAGSSCSSFLGTHTSSYWSLLFFFSFGKSLAVYTLNIASSPSVSSFPLGPSGARMFSLVLHPSHLLRDSLYPFPRCTLGVLLRFIFWVTVVLFGWVRGRPSPQQPGDTCPPWTWIFPSQQLNFSFNSVIQRFF